MSTQLRRACIALTAVLLAACGGGSDTVGPNTCSLTNPAGCGGSAPPPATAPSDPAAPPDPALKAAAVSLVVSSNELASAGLAGGDVNVTALVKSADNTAVPGAKIEFSADSGFLMVAGATTDKSGKANAVLGTGGSRLNRPIQVTVKVGTQSASAVVNVVGTRLMLAGPASLNVGSSADLLATVLDSAGRPISGAAVTASASNGNPVFVAAKVSDNLGQVPLRLDATRRGTEQLTLTAQGATTTRTISIGGSDVSVTPAVTIDIGGAELLKEVAVGSCSAVAGNYAIGGAGQAGMLTLAASRGTLYSDAACRQPLTGARALVDGNFPPSYIVSPNAGVSTIEARIAGGPSGSTRLEFVAPLGTRATLNLQSEAALLGAGERSTLIAVVRDGSAANNLVKGATVQFAIAADPSGGTLVAPFSAVTGSDGVARALFEAGPNDSGKDGTVIEARIAALPAASSQTRLTVNKKALSIQFGTGNVLNEFSSAVLQQDFAVFVSDSAGNPVRDVMISAAAWPTRYAKGTYGWVPRTALSPAPGNWIQVKTDECANEDAQRKGIFDGAYDLNGNGVLDPGIPLSIVASGKTDALGLTTLSLRYPRDRANWVRVELTVTGTVAGTESVARNAFWLSALAKDMTDIDVAPPGFYSPYGTGGCTSRD